MSPLEQLVAEAFDAGEVSAVIRPAAVLGEEATRAVLAGLAADDIGAGGNWRAEPVRWDRYTALDGREGAPARVLVGYLQVIYGAPTRYEITLYRAVITPEGARAGWTVRTLCDEALAHAGLTLENCPRATLGPPPRPFRLTR